MDLHEMKALWQASPATPVSIEKLKLMVKESSNPVLKKIKRQLLLEVGLWLLILCLYHNAFDGDKRPGGINLIFVIGFVQAIAYNLSSYFAARNLIQGTDIGTSLGNYVKTLRKLKWTAILSRSVLMAALIIYFSYGLQLDSRRIMSLVAIICLFGVQLLVIYGTWNRRIKKLLSALLLIQTPG